MLAVKRPLLIGVLNLLIVIAAEDIYIMEQLSTSGSAGTVTGHR